MVFFYASCACWYFGENDRSIKGLNSVLFNLSLRQFSVKICVCTPFLLPTLSLGEETFGSFHVKSTQKNPYPHRFERKLVPTQCQLGH